MFDPHSVNVKRLCIRVHYDTACYKLSEFYFPNVQHFIFYGVNLPKKSIVNSHFVNLSDFSQICPQVTTLELRTVVTLRKLNENHPENFFQNLKMFKFKPCNKFQIDIVKDIFEGNHTEIVILDKWT